MVVPVRAVFKPIPNSLVFSSIKFTPAVRVSKPTVKSLEPFLASARASSKVAIIVFMVETDADNLVLSVVIALLLFSINNRYGKADICCSFKPSCIKQRANFCSSVSVPKLHFAAACFAFRISA